ncbi:MAG: ribosome biogenesis GTP-binding protein YihA/YsxC [Bacteroidota bacterium]
MKKIEFVKAVYNLNDLPKRELPTIVLCGRSNVGKSSFINCLFSPSRVAKTSSTPGKTRSINYYLVDNKFYIVDLPGFGYAKVSQKEREYWKKLIEDYFNVNKTILSTFHLLDSRYDPTELDLQLNEFLKASSIHYNFVFNKVDKLKQAGYAALKKNAVKFFPEAVSGANLFFFSAIKGTGKKEIINHIQAHLL